jgi:hypothetical protein
MSMNLFFKVKGGSGKVDFPFQTSTDLTYAVLKAKGREEQIKLLSDEMSLWGWGLADINEMLAEIEALMDDPNLELTLI